MNWHSIRIFALPLRAAAAVVFFMDLASIARDGNHKFFYVIVGLLMALPFGVAAFAPPGTEELSVGTVLGYVPALLLVTRFYWGAAPVLGVVPPAARQVLEYRTSEATIVLALATWLIGASRLKHVYVLAAVFIGVLFMGIVLGFIFLA